MQLLNKIWNSEKHIKTNHSYVGYMNFSKYLNVKVEVFVLNRVFEQISAHTNTIVGTKKLKSDKPSVQSKIMAMPTTCIHVLDVISYYLLHSAYEGSFVCLAC